MSKVHLIFGPQGAGKSTYSKKLSKEINGVHISIDDWMWKLYGEDLPRPMNLKWIMDRVERCEKHIWTTSVKIFDCGCPIVLDLGFMKLAKRDLFRNLAESQNIPMQLHYIKASHALRRKRVLDRNIDKGDTYSFEVTPGMFDFMETEFENPIERELMDAVVIDTGDE